MDLGHPAEQGFYEFIDFLAGLVIRHASAKGIPYFQLQSEELRRELDASKKL